MFRQPWRAAWVVTFALLLGAVAGPLSWYAHDHLSGGARLLGDSAAAWLAIAFVAGRRARSVPGGAVAGFLALGTAVLAYYAVQQTYGTWTESETAVSYWQLLAAVTGPVAGGLGAASRLSRPLLRGLAVAAMSAAFCAEALTGYSGALSDATRDLYLREGLIGIAVLAVLCREWRSLLAGLCWLPVLSLAGMPLISTFLHAQHGGPLYLTRYLAVLG